jgi:glycosyltransferase involved in cell wall biosynthesis
LLKGLGVQDMVVELGAVPYRQLHQIYRNAHLYVTPAYTETFAHPLVEAMASGLPVVASDLAVHREICRDAALYFPAFSPQELGQRIASVICSPDVSAQLSRAGVERSTAFLWNRHVEQLIKLAQDLVARHRHRNQRNHRAVEKLT